MPRRGSNEDIPIKIGYGGWDGRFVRSSGTSLKDGYTVHAPTRNTLKQEIEVEPPSKQKQKEQSKQQYRVGSNQNRSDASQFFGYSNEPTVLPVQWDGKFAKSTDPNDVRYLPDRNRSNTSEFYGFNTEPEILPTEWSGKFETDPTDIRIQPERNQSDVRDYADHRNFVQRN